MTQSGVAPVRANLVASAQGESRARPTSQGAAKRTLDAPERSRRIGGRSDAAMAAPQSTRSHDLHCETTCAVTASVHGCMATLLCRPPCRRSAPRHVRDHARILYIQNHADSSRDPHRATPVKRTRLRAPSRAHHFSCGIRRERPFERRRTRLARRRPGSFTSECRLCTEPGWRSGGTKRRPSYAGASAFKSLT